MLTLKFGEICEEGRTGGGGGGRGSLARFTGRNNNEPRTTDITISFSRITKISKKNTLLSCFYAKKSGLGVSENTAKWRKEKIKTANSKL